MTMTTPAPTATSPDAPVTADGASTVAPSPARRRTAGLLRVGATAAVVAAVANELVAAVARAADVPMAIEGEDIPVTGYAVATLALTAVGLLLAGAIRRWAPAPRATFTGVALVLLALSFGPTFTTDATTATQLVLASTHLVAAAIVVPAVVRTLPARRTRG